MFHTVWDISSLELAVYVSINSCNFGVWFSFLIIQGGNEVLLLNTTSPFLSNPCGFCVSTRTGCSWYRLHLFIPVTYHSYLVMYHQGISKMPGQNWRVTYSHQNKEKSSYEHVSGNGWFFNLIEKLYSTINTLTM
jgi:hypothetical protein